MKITRYSLILLLILLLVSSCNSANPTSSTAPAPVTPVSTNVPPPAPTVLVTPADQNIIQNTAFQDLLGQITQQGINLELRGESRVAFLDDSAPGVNYRVNNQDQLFIHLYPGKDVAADFAKSIPKDADTGSTEWASAPHFFLCNSMIVVYVGRNTTITDSFVKICGPQFAGDT